MSTSISSILANRTVNSDVVTFNVTEDWGQGRTMFGGFLSALALVAMRESLSLDIPLRALQTNFVGPVAPGEAVFKTRLLRQGKSITQVQCDIYSADSFAGVVVGVFGAARPTQLPSHAPQKNPLAKQPDEIKPFPFMPGLMPNFLQHIDMRWGLGGYPYTGQGDVNSGIYMQLKDKDTSAEVQIVMLSDVPPTPMLSFCNGPVMASSVSWALELPPYPVHSIDDGWFQIDVSAVSYAEGYANQSAKLWTPQGHLASLGYQVVAVYG